MTLEKRIELTEQTLRTLNNMREKYKRPKQIDKDIEYNTEILGYLKELQELQEKNQIEILKRRNDEIRIR